MRTLAMCTLAVTLTGSVLIAQQKGRGRGPARPGLTLTSPDFEDGGVLPNKFSSADPMPVSPQLEWTHVPMGTESFVLIMHDPDVVFNKSPDNDVLHWLVWNIPGTATGLPQGVPAVAQSADGMMQGKNQGNVVGFRGPGAGAAGPYHHYTLDLYALDTKLMLSPDATRADVLKAMEGHTLAKAVLIARFHR